MTSFLVADGGKLVKIALECRPKLIITDNDMPVMKGIDAINIIRQIYKPAVIFITTNIPQGEVGFEKATLFDHVDEVVLLAKMLLEK